MTKSKKAPVPSAWADLGDTLARARAVKIRELRARSKMTHQDIAFTVGCSIKTVYNVLAEVTCPPAK